MFMAWGGLRRVAWGEGSFVEVVAKLLGLEKVGNIDVAASCGVT